MRNLSKADKRKRKIEVLRSYQKDYSLNSELIFQNEYLVFKPLSAVAWEPRGKKVNIKGLYNILKEPSLDFVSLPENEILNDLMLYQSILQDRKKRYKDSH